MSDEPRVLSEQEYEQALGKMADYLSSIKEEVEAKVPGVKFFERPIRDSELKSDT